MLRTNQTSFWSHDDGKKEKLQYSYISNTCPLFLGSGWTHETDRDNRCQMYALSKGDARIAWTQPQISAIVCAGNCCKSGGMTGPRIGKSAHRCKSAPWFPHELVPVVILMAIYRLGSPSLEPCPACVTCPCLEVCMFCGTEHFCVNTLNCSLAVQLKVCRGDLSFDEPKRSAIVRRKL
ncbi:hypothetical protein Mapa_008247 [Marchantia paleacea]|nr:hypothetical protein Mapa_008247 [Marchantia paleacea]